MKRFLPIAVLWMLGGRAASAAPPEPVFRLVTFDASSLPKTYAILDVRPEAAEAQSPAQSDFQLLEDGKATAAGKRTLKFRDTGNGLALIVAIDVSPSMAGRPIGAIRQGLVQLISRKRDNDRITVLTFAGDMRFETRWTASSNEMQDAFRNLQVRGNATRIFDAVNQAMDELEAQSRQDSAFPSRAGILVLSDGHDEGSRMSLDRVANRLRNSRIRLDAAGLAHTPIWLRSLQSLAAAGFGGFKPAATADQLTAMLSHGIDALLDMPAVEFEARNLSGDGKTHQLGVEYLPTHWRDQVAVTLPHWPVYRQPKFWAPSALIVLLLIGATSYFVIGRKKASVPAMAPVPPTAPPPRPAPSSVRTPTAAETAIDSRRVPAQRIPTAVEEPAAPATRSVSAAAAPAEPAPAPFRIPTILAPSPSNAAATTLAGVSGPYAGKRFPVSIQEFWIGSSANNHLCLNADPGVSGNHACIRREDRFFRIYDNGSLNNTIVNGRSIGREVVLLQPGDRIRIGQSEFVLEA